MINIFDETWNGMPASEMYRSWVLPDLFPHQKPALLINWPKDDLEMFVGGEFTDGYQRAA